MRRIKIMVAALLPLLGVAMGSHDFADALSGGTRVCCYRTLISAAAGHGQPVSPGDLSLSKSALRNPGRRAGMSNDPDGKLFSTPPSVSRLPGLKADFFRFSVVEAPAGLHRTWQFYLRMAPQPRAPSVVS